MLNILAMGAAHPTTKISNEFLESLGIDSSAEWISHNIGIENRATTLPLKYIKETWNGNPEDMLDIVSDTPTYMGIKAAQEAIKNAGIDPQKIGLLIHNSCNPDSFIPTQGQVIADALGLNCRAYDTLTACPAFSLLIDYCNNFKEDKLPEYTLVISAAALSQRVDYTNRSDSAIWGDGAAAAIVSTKHVGKLKVLDSLFMSDPKRHQAVTTETFGHFAQDGRAVRDFSVRQTVRLIKRIEEKCDIDWSRDVFIGHQANRTMLQQITNNRKIPDSNHWHNVTDYGNQGAAGSMAVLAQNWNNIQDNQKIVIAVLGAGLSWGSIVLEANKK